MTLSPGGMGTTKLTLTKTAGMADTVKFTATSTIGESTIPNVPGVFYRDAGVQVDHAFRRWLIGTVKLGVGLDTYKDAVTDSGGTFSESG